MEYHLWQLTARMTELLFNKRNGWSLDDVLLFQSLAKRYIILNEEHRGHSACRITVHNIQHIPDDALRFSHPDNYWCFSFERAVKRYISISNNFKNMECSFAKREGYRELLKLMSRHIQPQEETRFKVDLEKASILYLSTQSISCFLRKCHFEEKICSAQLFAIQTIAKYNKGLNKCFSNWVTCIKAMVLNSVEAFNFSRPPFELFKFKKTVNDKFLILCTCA